MSRVEYTMDTFYTLIHPLSGQLFKLLDVLFLAWLKLFHPVRVTRALQLSSPLEKTIPVGFEITTRQPQSSRL